MVPQVDAGWEVATPRSRLVYRWGFGMDDGQSMRLPYFDYCCNIRCNLAWTLSNRVNGSGLVESLCDS